MNGLAADAVEGESGDAAAEDRLSAQVRYEVLSARRRREVLRCLFEAEGDATLRDLSERLAAGENDVPREEVTYKQRTRVYTALRQNHLPKLDDAGVVSFDARSGDTSLRPAADDLRPYLFESERAGDAPPRYALASLTFAVVVVAGLAGDVDPLTRLPTVGWLGACTLLFALGTLLDAR